MRAIENVRNFLYDKEYFIDLFAESIHVFRYIDLLKLTDEEIILSLPDFNLEITGTNLRVAKMDKQEILIHGKIDNVRLKR